MKIICCKTYDEMSDEAAKIISRLLKEKKSAKLGLATGSTPVGTYERLAAAVAKGEISFAKASSYNLDEYVGLSPEHEQSYARFMRDNLFDKVDIDIGNTHIPSGAAKDADEECDRYTALLEQAGALDVQILGIGTNGHIGFNEPADVFYPNTHKVRLKSETVAANARFFEDMSDVPRFALTMGVRPIMLAKHVLLMASGSGKAVAVAKALNGPITPQLPASILQLHQNVTVIADEAALELAVEVK